MVKNKKSYRLGRSIAHHHLIVRNLVIALIDHEKIKTTETKAKQVKPVVDKMILLAKKGDLKSRRLALAELSNETVVSKLFTDIAGRYEERQSGFTRIVRLGFRNGDSAPLVQIELV